MLSSDNIASVGRPRATDEQKAFAKKLGERIKFAMNTRGVGTNELDEAVGASGGQTSRLTRRQRASIDAVVLDQRVGLRRRRVGVREELREERGEQRGDALALADLRVRVQDRHRTPVGRAVGGSASGAGATPRRSRSIG